VQAEHHEVEAHGWRWFPDRGVSRTLLEILIVVPAYALYQLVRGTVDARTPEAFDRAARLVDIEQGMGIFWEDKLQDLILNWDVAVRIVNAI
jgi:hypothetical protein